MSDVAVTGSSVAGRVLWYELMTTDTKAAEAFYTKVVGWTVTPFEGAAQPYDIWTHSGDQMVGGVMKIPEGMNFPPHWGMYVGVTKLEDGVGRVQQLGGRALGPLIDVPTVGRMQTMLDPQGAAFSIYEPASPPTRPESEPQVGDVSWHELYTTDAEAALQFYTALFGWRPTESMDMGEMGKYHMFGRTLPLGGMMKKPPELAHVPPHWMFYFQVPDINDGVSRVKANGGQVLNGPMEVPGGDWIINCMDPQGAAFSLHQRKK
jgi:predicted enzyme related to lactoylglutathione lyase